MRKQDSEIQPFEVIEDGRGRYTTGPDLVRPDDELKEPPRRIRPLVLLIWIAVVVIIGLIFILPAIDLEMMRSPMMNLTGAVNARDAARMRNSFTPDAKIGFKGYAFTASETIDAVEPYLNRNESVGSLRFAGFRNLRPLGKGEYKADFTVKVDLEDDSLPYRHVEISKTGHVQLQRVGWFRWKVAYLTSSEPEFDEAMNLVLLQHVWPAWPAR